MNKIIDYHQSKIRDRGRTDVVKVQGKNSESNSEAPVLTGVVNVQGSKNAALPIIASSILLKQEITLRNVPDIVDVKNLLNIMESIGVSYSMQYGVLRLNTANVRNDEVKNELTKKIRASSILLGPLLSVFGKSGIGTPGGCSIGSRPLNLHFEALESLGVVIRQENELIKAEADELDGDYTLPFPSVGATQNVIAASVLRAKKVILRNIAIEPEIKSYIEFLKRCGAKIKFIEPNTVSIEGVSKLEPKTYTIPGDRIEAGTILAAGFLTKGDVEVKNVPYKDISHPLQTLKRMGAIVEKKKESIRVAYDGVIKSVPVVTSVFPGFPTDLQAIWSILLTQAEGASVINENIFNNRFQHLEEMSNKMNLKVEIMQNHAYMQKSELTGNVVYGNDLRGTAALILAGLVAEGETVVMNINQLHRGYELLVEKLRFLGADIAYTKIKDDNESDIKKLIG